MPSVQYGLEFNYRIYQDEAFPMLTIELRNPGTGDSVDQDAFLDSGASRSVFMGQVAAMLGLDLLTGQPWAFETNTGQPVQARIHPVEIALSDGGAARLLRLEMAFSMVDIRRNLLGRDFFNLAQVGFRERYGQFFLEPEP